MAPKSQNKPPVAPTPSSPSKGKYTVDEVSVDKKRKIANTKMPSTATGVRHGRQAFAVLNGSADLPPTSGPPSSSGSDSGVIEFSKEDVEALLVERRKKKNQFNTKEQLDQMSDYIRRLKQCIKWFQQLEGTYVSELASLKSLLESEEKKCEEKDMLMKSKEEELNAIIMELRKNLAVLQDNLKKEESEKMEALNSFSREKETRVAAESLQASLSEELNRAKASLSEELNRAKKDLIAANEKIQYLHGEWRRSQEYNTSLQQYNSKLQAELADKNETLNRVEKEKAVIVETHSTLRGHYSSLEEQLASSRAAQAKAKRENEKLANEVECLRGDLQNTRNDLDSQISKVVKYKEGTEKSVAELANLTEKSDELEDRCRKQDEQIRRLQEKLSLAEARLQMSDKSALETKSEYEMQKEVINELNQRMSEAETKIVEGEKLRKKLHNTILELKGNIRVFCRVRPALSDDAISAENVVSFPTSLETLGRGIDLTHNGQKHSFTFDKVFVPEASQKDVFDEISQLVQSALDGYKVCIFAYGQTGSGKTYTMMGNPRALGQQGLIPRTLEQVFQTRQSHLAQGWKYDMQVSMLEIYNETIRDLLSPNRSGFDASRTDNGGKQYAIKHDVHGNTYVSDLTIVDVRSSNEVSYLLERAAQSRSVGKTQMNEQSSRSHFVFTLRISGVNKSTEQQVQGVLNLIDLAGSERLSRSGATGDRLKETQAINKSLSSLSDVIFALAKKEEHVPFRNSKLTYLLQPCLGGDSKTLMFVNLSPDPASAGESLCSLRLAARVNACEIGVPRRQTSLQHSRLSIG